MTKTLDAKLQSITELAREQYRLEALIKSIEEQLKEKKEALRRVVEQDLPTAMDDADLQTFKLKNGYTIKIEDDMYVGITEERRTEAFTWLRENGHGSLIKRDVTFKFGKGDEALAKKLLAAAKKVFGAKKAKGIPITDKETVHYQTLKAFCREQIAAGENIPMETFGIIPVRRAKITQPE